LNWKGRFGKRELGARITREVKREMKKDVKYFFILLLYQCFLYTFVSRNFKTMKNQKENTLLGEVMIDRIIEQYEDETFLKSDGFDEAIIGVDETTMRLIYSVKKCIEILMRDMSEEDAMEHFSFNVSGSYVGDKTPIWCSDNFA